MLNLDMQNDPPIHNEMELGSTSSSLVIPLGIQGWGLLCLEFQEDQPLIVPSLLKYENFKLIERLMLDFVIIEFLVLGIGDSWLF